MIAHGRKLILLLALLLLFSPSVASFRSLCFRSSVPNKSFRRPFEARNSFLVLHHSKKNWFDKDALVKEFFSLLEESNNTPKSKLPSPRVLVFRLAGIFGFALLFTGLLSDGSQRLVLGPERFDRGYRVVFETKNWRDPETQLPPNCRYLLNLQDSPRPTKWSLRYCQLEELSE